MRKATEQLLDLTKKIQTAAEQDEWDDVAKSQAAREELLAQIGNLSVPKDEETSQAIERLIIEIRNIDEQTLPMIIERMRKLSQDRKQTNKGKKMTKAYQST